ncbi:dihydrolipoamide dehydrogenase [Gammaproteobacteria bacterium 45_16_T64]|nr:dihydrolipoamide dehydrogenase [Gammaproteobacteria bacterium 45_16_T64]
MENSSQLTLIVSALKVASVVGTVLLLINQYDALFGPAEVRYLPALLTYCVPFVVFIAGQRSALKRIG